MSRSFNSNFNTEKNKVSPDGPAPLNIIRFGFSTPITISDRVLSETVVTPRVTPLTLFDSFSAAGVGIDHVNGVLWGGIDGNGIYKKVGAASWSLVEVWGGTLFYDFAINTINGDVWVGTSTGIYVLRGGDASAGFVLFDGTSAVYGVDVDHSTGNIWAVIDNKITMLDAQDESSGFVFKYGAFGIGRGVAYDHWTGTVYSTTTNNSVWKHTSEGSEAFNTGLIYSSNYIGICVDYQSRDIFLSRENDKIYKYPYGGSSWETFDSTIRNWQYLNVNRYTGDMYAGITTDIYLSTGETSETTVDAEGLLKSWGFIDSSSARVPGGSIIHIPSVPDLQVTIINSEDPRFTDSITTADPIEGIDVTLYQSFEGLDEADWEVLFVGVVRGQPTYNEETCQVLMRGSWIKYNRIVGNDLLINEDDYPYCDPDDVGKMQNIGYGELSQVPALVVDGNGVDNLSSAAGAGDTTLNLVDTSKLRSSGQCYIEEELISYSGKTSTTLTGVTRGVSGTTPAAHPAGAVIYQYYTYTFYQIAGHAVKTITDIYADGFAITNAVVVYTGQSGDQASAFGYGAEAIVRISKFISKANAISLLEDNGMSNADATAAVTPVSGTTLTISDIVALFNATDVDQGDHEHTATETISVWKFEQVNAFANVSTPYDIIDSNFSTGAVKDLTAANGTVTVGKTYYEDYPGPPTEFRVCMAVGSNTAPVTLSFAWGSRSVSTTGNGIPVKSSWYAVDSTTDTWAKVNVLTGLATLPYVVGAPITAILEVWIEFKHTDSPGSSPADGVVMIKPAGVTRGINKTTLNERGGRVTRSGIANLSGNTIAEVEVGKLVTADFSGILDDGSGTITGTPDALIENPAHVFEHFLTEYCSFPSANIGSSFGDTATLFDNSDRTYTFSTILRKPQKAELTLAKWAVQCRSRFYVAAYGTAQLIFRELGQSSAHAIPKSEIKFNSVSMKLSGEEDIINSFNVLFDPDWRKEQDPFQRNLPYTDATSISRYGTREAPNPSAFFFDAVRDPVMVADVATFWLDLLKLSRKMPKLAVFLDNLEIEVGDIIDITYPLDSMSNFVVEVLTTRNILGSGANQVIDHIELFTLEN